MAVRPKPVTIAKTASPIAAPSPDMNPFSRAECQCAADADEIDRSDRRGHDQSDHDAGHNEKK